MTGSSEAAGPWMADEANPIACYQKHGYAILPTYTPQETAVIHAFAVDWIYRLLEPWVRGRRGEYPLEKYHLWSGPLGVDHGNVFRAVNRHTEAEGEIRRALINDRISRFLVGIGAPRTDFWNEGIGWLAFRFIRPGVGDGYPMTRKEWSGAVRGDTNAPTGVSSKTVISTWIPVIGYTSKETLCLVPGSHVREYKCYMPEGSKFMREYRLAEPLEPGAIYRPNLKPGEIIVYHPRTLHSEEVVDSPITRLNLEARFSPIPGKG